ncbi:MAG: choloylglycine hydrolase family protein [Oscillospiraceae bacterium]|nr:choloylglycine hydrolase family protein [Oscillospiraceae bacterium]
MCTAATYKTKDFYFGRTLDYDFSYGDEIVITPRNYPLPFRSMPTIKSHFAMIGMAHVEANYPLYYEAVNEKGLGMAGLNFVGNAQYQDDLEYKNNIATFELIPWILAQCATIKQAQSFLEKINLTTEAFSEALPPAQLHWLLADREECIVVEAVKEGLFVYPNPTGILTNNPPFPTQLFQLNNYMHLSTQPPENHFSSALPLLPYGRGMGALGLPGDLSSQSRFVRASFVKMNSVSGDSEPESVSQFFHILNAVDQQRGCCEVEAGKYEMTLYTCCCNADKGVYYYTTYDNHQISAVDLHKENLDGFKLVRYAPISTEQIHMQN